MYAITDTLADLLVDRMTDQAAKYRTIADSPSLRGPAHKDARRRYRELARDAERVIAGLNTGEGVTRESAKLEAPPAPPRQAHHRRRHRQSRLKD